MPLIYLSSSYQDLKEYREAVVQQVRRLDGFQIKAMEDYVAQDARPLNRVIQDVESCDVYVGVFAWRYGFIPEGETSSITELEYKAARAGHKECLIFLVDEDAPWSPQQMDSRGPQGGQRIEDLRARLKLDHMISFFKNKDNLASLVSAAVDGWRARQQGAHAPPPPAAEPAPLFREVQRSLFVAYAPGEEPLGRACAALVQRWVDRPVFASSTALLAEKEQELVALERSVTSCEAGLVVVSPATLSLLAGKSASVAKVAALMRARLGNVRFLSCGDPGPLPASWQTGPLFLAPPGPPDVTAAPSQAIGDLQQWVADVCPAEGRSVGLPVCVLTMNKSEIDALALPGGQVTPGHAQLISEVEALASAGVDWRARYGATREDWQPFGPGGSTIAQLLQEVVGQVNARGPSKLRQRRIKLQWYPFDPLQAEAQNQDPGLRRIYREMARGGCVLILDELSLLNAGLVDAFYGSPLINNDRVAIVTVSPDPRRSVLSTLLETEARNKLASAFDRFDGDLDPQCEIAVADARRLRRWLHANVPETVTNLREPPPNTGRMDSFFQTAGVTSQAARAQDGYPWGSGGAR